MDLGVHLVDLVLWLIPGAQVAEVVSVLRAGGRPPGADAVEDYAVATLTLNDGCVVRLACSWRLPAGQDAVISAAFYGEGGGAEFRNVGGSFYDFVAERFDGSARRTLAGPPDDWGGRAAADWARRLATHPAYDPQVESVVAVARTLDRIYGRT
ncbi:MAG: hypothetical protein A2623_10630 [Caulobacterales bacterium RIFCSPHIGHO2_01_FULL_70_19]|nr:MAG: hypothetical protein A2623_10630 [Caulobacterales bacterium RIFCSPHIGHO2_01_FULL_70_19]